jgi:hypothetical protein
MWPWKLSSAWAANLDGKVHDDYQYCTILPRALPDGAEVELIQREVAVYLNEREYIRTEFE